MSTKKKTITTTTTAETSVTPVVTLVLEESEPPVRAQSGLYLATLQSMIPGSKSCFKISAQQKSSVIQAAYKAKMRVKTASINNADKTPTGLFKVWRTQ